MKKKISLGIIVIVLLYGYYFITKKWGVGIPCFFEQLTGYYCPGCGVTRMTFSLIHLDFYGAFRYNPLVFCLILLFILYKLIKIEYRNIKLPKWVAYVLLIIVVGFGILRNIPGFEYLKPIG